MTIVVCMLSLFVCQNREESQLYIKSFIAHHFQFFALGSELKKMKMENFPKHSIQGFDLAVFYSKNSANNIYHFYITFTKQEGKSPQENHHCNNFRLYKDCVFTWIKK